MPPPDQAAPDQEPPDQALPDMPLPDQALPDMPLPDQEPPDQALPDMPVPDLLQPDKLQPDILSPDLFPQVKVLNPLGFRIDKTSKVHPTLMNPALAKGGTATSSPGTMAPPKVRASMAGWSPCPAP